ncbi:hypothetical protein [Deinococcus maricopensis]|uniref:Uncharacterized protein n=1 Tax=Deinococcus maricopensis (strain DSM 21211 / LMG 22137 / NRRL B-23946 / LB-34) TaxID=709986 RepID=E8U4M1_DEIML|nr:hypothetical protein [Deinococcus maricopensis]ADV68886.1 hypothetical protein Deima_3259 [Deinococcus maricopensis DSM 21211]
MRRLPPQTVAILSLLAAALCAIPAVRYGLAHNWLPTLLWGAVAVWFAVDGIRALGWSRNR